MANYLNKVKPGEGVFEWAGYSYNIGTGCFNKCRYCYALEIAIEMAKKEGKVLSSFDWQNERVKAWKSEIHQTADGIIMFPSMHDITPSYLPLYTKTLRNLVEADNQVVIVTKPRIECIRTICEQFQDCKNVLLFRMTITSLDDNLSRLWEPGAPLPYERVAALRLAFESGYQTSVSVEPMIGSVEHTIDLYKAVYPYLTEDIWFGKMNNISRRVELTDQSVRDAVGVIKDQQSNTNIRTLYNALKDQPKVMWKDSIREVVGL